MKPLNDQEEVTMSKQGSTTLMPAPPQTSSLKPWNVIVHNSDGYDLGVIDVISSLVRFVKLDQLTAALKAVEFKTKGLSIVATAHKEHAELLERQLQGDFLLCTIEPT